MAIQELDLSSIRSKKILAIGAHPDDLEIGVGGTLLKLNKNNTIAVVMVTSGQMGSQDMDAEKGDIILIREEEQRRAAKKYKVSKVLFLQFPDMFVAEHFKRLRKRLIKLLVKTRPDIVITHDPWAEYFPYHPDHRAVGFAVLEAVVAASLPLYLKKKSVTGKPLDQRPQLWLMHPNRPSHAVDITKLYTKKLEAIKDHKSQFDRMRVWEKVEKLSEKYFRKVGKAIGVEYAEPLKIIEQ